MVDNDFRFIDPRTWPWVMWVWLAFVVASFIPSLWKRYQRHRSATWPLTQGHIETLNVTQPSRWSHNRGQVEIAEIGYSYSIDGTVYGGHYQRSFGSADAAWEFLRDLKGKPITVHYNLARPSSSSIAEDSLETLIQTRPPIPEGSLREEYAAPVWVKPFLWLGVAYSAVGLILSLYVHIGALRGRQVLPEAFFFSLHIGIFVVWFPVVFLAKELSKGVQQKQDFWRGVLKGAPGWMLYMVYGFGAYAVVNFAIFLLHSPAKHVGSSGPSLVEWRGFSGHWMVFYSAAMAVLYSAANYGKSERTAAIS